MASISGITSDDSRLIILDQTTWNIESSTEISAGAYEVTGLNTNTKAVFAVRLSDNDSQSYANVTPIGELTFSEVYGDVAGTHIESGGAPWTYRMKLSNTKTSAGASSVKLELRVHESFTINDVFLGKAGTPGNLWDMEVGTATRITFDGGSSSVALTGGVRKMSDIVAFSFLDSDDLMLDVASASPQNYYGSTDSAVTPIDIWKAGYGQAGLETTASFNDYATNILYVVETIYGGDLDI